MANVYLEISIRKVVLDVFLVACVGFPILFFFLLGDPYVRGFYCNDESLLHPYHGSTIPSFYLYIIGIGMNALLMIVIEYITRTRNAYVRFCGRLVPSWIWSSYCVISVYGFGAVCSQLTTDVIKYSVGRLRPHFFTVCEPNIDCTLPENLHKYIVDYECTNPTYMNDARTMTEMRLSFPSGHSSFSMYAMTYLAIYLHSRMTWDGSKLLKHTLQYVAILAAIFTGMTRISDYKHHWSDVLGGLLMGAVTACIVAKYISDLFPKKSEDNNGAPNELSPLKNSTTALPV